MSARPWALLGALLLTVAAAGCTNRGGDDADGGTPGPDGGNGPFQNGTAPENVVVEDAGSIQGPFTKSWPIEVENIAFASFTIHFELAGVQGGAPPTARVNLQLLDPEDGVVESATLGIGSSNVAEWSFTPGDLPGAGTYTLQASPGDGAPLPSVGLATYTLHAEVTY